MADRPGVTSLCTVLCTVSVCLLSACAPTTAPPAPVAEVAQPPTPEPMPGLTAKQRISRALDVLEDGDEAVARVELIAYLDKAPESRLARSLLRQIDTPPMDYFPAAYREVEVEAGQSLSSIAEYYLGSALEFHALAKYNGIDRPGQVAVGETVRIPLTPVAEDAFGIAPAPGEVTSTSTDGDMMLTPAEDGEPMAAPDEMVAADDDVPADAEEAETTVVDATDEIGADDDLPSAAAAEVTAPVAVSGSDAATAVEAVAAVEEPAPPPVDLDALHRRAITAYRAQNLDAAIALWEEILAIDPGYESARLYRTQALSLKERLQELN